MPDFRIRSSVSVEGVGSGCVVVSESRLAELKVLSSSPTRYARAHRSRVKAVKRRADQLPIECLKHARKVNSEYGGVKEGLVVPVEAKLASFPRIEGWVFGKWAECSPDVHNLIREMAKSRISRQQELERKERRGRKKK